MNNTDTNKAMTGIEIYELANKMTDQEVDQVVKSWESAGEIKKIKTFKSLVSLGDSKKLACATAIAYRQNTDIEMFKIAYES
jgi:phosphopantetheinyl transferase (holo-ACP synthase)